MRSFMDSQLKQKKVITVVMTKIDLLNLNHGEVLKSQVKTNFETEVPYEIVVKIDGQADEDNRV